MDKSDYKIIINNLEGIFSVLNNNNHVDGKLRNIYSEFLIGYKLLELGFNVQIRNERENTNADIYLPDIKKRIEIKSGKYSLIDNFLTTEASFGKGKQLIDNKFDYLVFVTFDETIEGKVNEMFVFTYKAMKELINYSRPEISGFNTNTYLLNIFKKYEEYKKWIKNNNSKSFYLEDNLNKNPEEYNNAWDKIKA